MGMGSDRYSLYKVCVVLRSLIHYILLLLLSHIKNIATIEDSNGYWGVWLANTCMGDFLGWEGVDEHSDEHSEDDHDHDDDKDIGTGSVLDPETTKNTAFSVDHIKVSAAMILLIGAALVL